MAHGFLHVRQGVEGFHRLFAGALVALGLPGGVALLNVGGVPQHDGQQVGGQTGAIDVAGKALLGQQGNAAGVVDVGVSDDDVVDFRWVKVQCPVIDLVPTLLQAAVHQNAPAAAFHAVTASGDRLCRAEKGEFHGNSLPSKNNKGRCSGSDLLYGFN